MHMLKILTAASVALCLSAAPALSAPLATVAESQIATLSVGGHGIISGAPDRGIIDVSIVTHDDVASQALSDNNAHYAALSAKIDPLGIRGSAIKTTGFSTNFNPRPEKPNVQFGQIYGFIVTRSLQITPPTLNALGPAIDAITAAGATTIGGLAYSLSDEHAARVAALSAAIADATDQAHTMAKAAGVQIVRVLQISNQAPPNVLQPRVAFDTFSLKRAVATTIAPSDVTVNSTITMVFEIR